MSVCEIWTDGACSGNPGPGGWAAVLRFDDGAYLEVCGKSEGSTTNQRMELTAAIEALKVLEEPTGQVRIYSDSAYVVNAMTERWIERWQAKNWRNSAKKAVANQDLWRQLLDEERRHELVTWIKTKGHSTDEMNNRADLLAQSLCS